MFNKDILCPECIEAERKHPLYELARQKEHIALIVDLRDFPGIGWPPDERFVSEMQSGLAANILQTVQARYKSGEMMFRGQTRRLGEKLNMLGEKLPGKWVYGGLFNGAGDFSIIYGGETEAEIEKFVVYTDTLGQYTGLKDKRKNRIFEGDICRYFKTNIGFISNRDGSFVVNHATPHLERPLSLCTLYDDFEIIGNIHDNPELVKSLSA